MITTITGCCCCSNESIQSFNSMVNELNEDLSDINDNLEKGSSSNSLIPYNQAMQGAKPVVVNFHMKGCGACRKALPVLNALVNENMHQVEFSLVMLSNNQSLVREYGVRAFPTVFMVDPSSSKKIEIPNQVLFDKSSYKKFIEQHWKNYSTMVPENLYKEAQQLYTNGEYKEAIEKCKLVLEFYPENQNVKNIIEKAQQELNK